MPPTMSGGWRTLSNKMFDASHFSLTHDGIRTRNPRLRKAMRCHCATRALAYEYVHLKITCCNLKSEIQTRVHSNPCLVAFTTSLA